MPGSTTSVFGEPDDFCAALRGHGNVNLYLTGHGGFSARFTKLKMYRLRIAAVTENLSRIGFLAVPPDTVLVVLPIGDAPPPIWGGNQPANGDLMTFGPGHRIHVRTHGPCRWGAMWLSAQDLAGYFHEMTNSTLTIAAGAQPWRAPKHMLRLHAAAIRAVEVRPKTIVDTEAAHGMEQQLVEALVKCLSGKPLQEQSRPGHWSQEIVVRFEELLESRRDGMFREDELGAALGVSAHSLRAGCMQELGMSPISYIRLRALHRVHSILQGRAVEVESVSQVARDQGFRDLGRFAESYRILFGQLPSTTSSRLHRMDSIGP